MSDQTPGTATVDAARHNGLMSKYQKALSMLSPEQRAALKEPEGQGQGPEAQDLTGGSPEGDSRQAGPDYEDGELYERQGDSWVPFEPPTPGRPTSGLNRLAGKREPTEADLRQELDRIVGKPSRGHEWPDPTAGA